jgi:mannose-6-phosphate isomerase-like protein (cupin superfamily)
MVPLHPFSVSAGAGAAHSVLGAPYRFIVTNVQSGGSFALIEATAPPRSAVPLHVHRREDETFFILEGIMEATCADLTVPLKCGSTIFLPRNIPHSYRNPSDETARYLILITPGGFEKCLEEFAALPSDQPPSMEILAAIGKKYGLEFPSPAS